MSVYQEKLPSRTGPVLLIVFGALGMVLSPIIALLIAAGMLMSSIDMESLETMQTLSNPGTSRVLEAGTYSVLPDAVGRGSANCSVTDEAGTALSTETVFEAIVTFEVVTPQAVTVECSQGVSIALLKGNFISVIVDSVPMLGGMVLAGVGLAFLGLVMLIAGIIWNISVGRRRREMMNSGFGGGPGGYTYDGYAQDYQRYGTNPSSGYTPVPPDFDPYAPPSRYGGPPQQGQPPHYGGSPQYGQQPPRNPYGQGPNEPPRYGERIDPYNP